MNIYIADRVFNSNIDRKVPFTIVPVLKCVIYFGAVTENGLVLSLLLILIIVCFPSFDLVSLLSENLWQFLVTLIYLRVKCQQY